MSGTVANNTAVNGSAMTPELFDSLVNLEHSGLTVLDEKIMNILISKPNLRYLKLAHNNLKELPDMSQIKNLEYLDISDNPDLIKNVPALMDALYTIKNLKHLHMDLLTEQDEENLIVSMSSLSTYNGTRSFSFPLFIFFQNIKFLIFLFVIDKKN